MSSPSSTDRELTERCGRPDEGPVQAARVPDGQDVSEAADDERPGFLILLLRALSAWNV